MTDDIQFGQFLRREREARGVSLEEVARATKIRRAVLEAMEDERAQALPPDTVVRGFLRAYARYIGVDIDGAMSRYEAWRASLAAERVQPAGDSVRRADRSPRVFIAMALVLVVVVMLLTYVLRPHLQDVAPEVPSEPASEAVTTGPPPTPPAGTAEEKSVETLVVERHQPPPVPDAMTATSPAEQPPGHAPVPAVKEMDRVEHTAGAAPVPATPQRIGETITGESQGTHMLTIKALDRTWLQVKVGSSPVDDITLYPQETYVRRSTESFELVIGNAGGVTITFDGTDMGSPGEKGQVVRLIFPKEAREEPSR